MGQKRLEVLQCLMAAEQNQDRKFWGSANSVADDLLTTEICTLRFRCLTIESAVDDRFHLKQLQTEWRFLGSGLDGVE